MRSRGLVASLTLALMIGGTGGVIAAGGGGDDGSAAKSQYRPGKGCGDKNHTHARHDECKDNGGGDHGGHGDHGHHGGGNDD